ncbi:hypothetical protein GCM10010421_44190 [Streptomyces glaucus]|uniref:Secreted protein n=1 Tax=Streptomyces glaucus TaxID=284029 RepID=A0ABP5XDS6_9ACTN
MGTPRDTTGSDPAAGEAEAGSADAQTQAAVTATPASRVLRGLRAGFRGVEGEGVVLRLTAHSSLCSGAGEENLAPLVYRR